MRAWLVRFVAWLTRSRRDAELELEVQGHLDLLAADHARRGVLPTVAREAARREFGSIQQVKETYRDQRGLPWLDDLIADGRYAVRALVKTPAFTIAAVATLAIGIGAHATVFSLVNAVLLRPLPYKDSDRLVRIIETIPAGESMSGSVERTGTMDPEIYGEWRMRTRTLSHMALRRPVSMTLLRRGEAVRLNGSQVSMPLFPMLQVTPVLGRVFEANEEKPGADHVVILSHNTWRTHFSADPAALGRSISLDGDGYTVVGVMPPGFAFPDVLTDFWVPLALTIQPGQFIRLEVVARVKEELTIDAASAEANAFSRDLLGEPRVDIVGWQDELVAPVRPALIVFAVAVTLVLLIACVNVANLFLARATAQHREIAIRMALGAGRRRVLRQLLTESLMVALVGGAAGCAVAVAGTRILRAVGGGLNRLDLVRMDSAGNTIPRLTEVTLDMPVLVYACAIAVVPGASSVSVRFGTSAAQISFWRSGSRLVPHRLLRWPGLRIYS